jgi:NADH-quinone oxidoreductase subunit E
MSAAPPIALQEPEPEVMEEIEQLLEKWKDQEGNLIMILHEIQNKYGFVPRDVALAVAKRIGIRLAQIYEVLTFYHYFKLVAPGKHNVMVCNGTACYLKGCAQIISKLETVLGIREGQTTKDQMFHLETVRCIGCCGMSPAMVVDGRTLGKVKPDDMKEMIDEIKTLEKAAEEERN